MHGNEQRKQFYDTSKENGIFLGIPRVLVTFVFKFSDFTYYNFTRFYNRQL